MDQNTDAPESYYRTTSADGRRRLREAVIVAHRTRVRAYVRRFFAPKFWEEAEQVGAIGLLVALERFDASRGVPFWFFAVIYVRKELQRWQGHAIHWRPSTNGAKGRTVHTEHLHHASMDNELASGGTLHEVLTSNLATVEDLVATAEGVARVEEFARTLSDCDRRILFGAKRKVRNPESEWARRYRTLVTQATAFVLGKTAS